MKYLNWKFTACTCTLHMNKCVYYVHVFIYSICILCILACLQVSVAALEMDPQFSIGTCMIRVLYCIYIFMQCSTCTMYYYSVTI